MVEASAESTGLPSARDLRRAVLAYLDRAYGGSCPATVQRLIPPEGCDVRKWLMSEAVERDPADAPLHAIRSFALRLGNAQYPHMKLRLSRPPRDGEYLFSVDAHDAFLHAPPSSPDHKMLEDLKRHNAAIAAAINSAWDAAGLLTERNYLRRKIQQAKEERPGPDAGPEASE